MKMKFNKTITIISYKNTFVLRLNKLFNVTVIIFPCGLWFGRNQSYDLHKNTRY